MVWIRPNRACFSASSRWWMDKLEMTRSYSAPLQLAVIAQHVLELVRIVPEALARHPQHFFGQVDQHEIGVRIFAQHMARKQPGPGAQVQHLQGRLRLERQQGQRRAENIGIIGQSLHHPIIIVRHRGIECFINRHCSFSCNPLLLFIVISNVFVDCFAELADIACISVSTDFSSVNWEAKRLAVSSRTGNSSCNTSREYSAYVGRLWGSNWNCH
jgi:hypothetical protein